MHKTPKFTNKSSFYSDKPGLVLVEFNSKETVQVFLKVNRLLRNKNNNKTFINQDLKGGRKAISGIYMLKNNSNC